MDSDSKTSKRTTRRSSVEKTKRVYPNKKKRYKKERRTKACDVGKSSTSPEVDHSDDANINGQGI